MVKVIYVVNNSVYTYETPDRRIAEEFVENLAKCGCVGCIMN